MLFNTYAAPHRIGIVHQDLVPALMQKTFHEIIVAEDERWDADKIVCVKQLSSGRLVVPGTYGKVFHDRQEMDLFPCFDICGIRFGVGNDHEDESLDFLIAFEKPHDMMFREPALKKEGYYICVPFRSVKQNVQVYAVDFNYYPPDLSELGPIRW